MPSLENKVVTHITLYVDASTQNRPPYVYAKQYDANSRYLVVRIVDSNKGIAVTGTAQLNATKPDGTHSYITGTANEDGTVTIGLTPNLLAVEGKISCDITVFDSADGDQVLLTTSTFFILVDKSNYDSDAIESTDKISTVGEKIDDLILKQEGDENKLFLAYQGETIGEGVVLPATEGVQDIYIDEDGYMCFEYSDGTSKRSDEPIAGSVFFDSFPTEEQILSLPNNTYFKIRSQGKSDEQEGGSYFKTSSWRADALQYTAEDNTAVYVVPIEQPNGEIYLPFYGIRTGEENAERNSEIIAFLSNTVQYGSTFRFPVGSFYFSEPIDVSAKHISIQGAVATNHKNEKKVGITFLHFPNLAKHETALTVRQCSLADFVVCGTPGQYSLQIVRENSFTDINTVVRENVGVEAYGIKASGGMLINNVGLRNFYFGCYCETANMFISDATFHICHYGLSIGNDIKVNNISGADVMTLLQMRGALSSALGVRGDSVGDHLVEITGGGNHTLMDLDADFCMNAIVSIGDGENTSDINDLIITGVHGRAGVRHFFALTDEEITANDITADTVGEYGVIAVQNGSSLNGAVIVTNQSPKGYNSPFDGEDDYAVPFVLLSAGANTVVNGVKFISTCFKDVDLTEEWTKGRIASLSDLHQACCDVKVETSNGYVRYLKKSGTVTIFDDTKDIYERMDKSAFALNAEVVKTVNGIYPDESGNVIVSDEEPEFVQSEDEFVDTSKKYVLPDGYIYVHRRIFVPGATTPNFTNQLPISKDVDLTSVYNGVGYKERTDYVEDQEVSSDKNNFLSGLIPIKEGANLFINHLEATLWAGDPIIFFIGSDGITTVGDIRKGSIDYIINAGGAFEDDPAPDEIITGARILSNVRIPINSTICWRANEIAYIRICPFKHKISPVNVIVTVDEEITYTVTEDHYEEQWVKGELYEKPDYAAMIAELQGQIQSLEERISALEK